MHKMRDKFQFEDSQPRRRVDRPRGRAPVVTLALPADLLARIDRWQADHFENNRPATIRALIVKALDHG
jgi:hypothetical protein